MIAEGTSRDVRRPFLGLGIATGLVTALLYALLYAPVLFYSGPARLFPRTAGVLDRKSHDLRREGRR